MIISETPKKIECIWSWRENWKIKKKKIRKIMCKKLKHEQWQRKVKQYSGNGKDYLELPVLLGFMMLMAFVAF